MRALTLLTSTAGSALLASPAYADPAIALTARHAAVPEGGDHGEWNGIELALEASPFARTSLRLDLALDHIVGTSDEAAYAYDGYQFTGLGGVRIAINSPTDPVRLYYAAGIGTGWRSVETPRSSAASNLYAEPVRLGLEIAVASSTALRVETALILRPTDFDPLALTIGAGIAFRL